MLSFHLLLSLGFAVTLRSSADSKEYGSEVSCIAGAKVNGVWSLKLEIRRTCVSKVRKYALFFLHFRYLWSQLSLF